MVSQCVGVSLRGVTLNISVKAPRDPTYARVKYPHFIMIKMLTTTQPTNAVNRHWVLALYSLAQPLLGPGMSLHPSSEYSRPESLPIITVPDRESWWLAVIVRSQGSEGWSIMPGGTLTPLRDGVHLRGQDQVSQKRAPPQKIPIHMLKGCQKVR